uniref:Uncharacterized protein n=1 Tax=Eucampia antarctica TaxID=49252 RepID=A0A7S2R015_9STRA|mmetsp:Transcript_10630/g.10188  ORF Transcript_10630/g.10188 Transcript_10630/m.10188 type:complete len:168 (+) Transcript_10630:158-661(+)
MNRCKDFCFPTGPKPPEYEASGCMKKIQDTSPEKDPVGWFWVNLACVLTSSIIFVLCLMDNVSEGNIAKFYTFYNLISMALWFYQATSILSSGGHFPGQVLILSLEIVASLAFLGWYIHEAFELKKRTKMETMEVCFIALDILIFAYLTVRCVVDKKKKENQDKLPT